ncbi:MAG: MAE_28990/MAE_18760 family HEPN-like nuclease [Cyanobium sp.]
MAIIDDISRDLDWREAEIASMRLLLSRKDISSKQVEVLLRAAWALLYAHYEGFVKYCLTLFYEEISRRSVKCAVLPNATQVFAKVLKQIRTMPLVNMITEVSNFKDLHLDSLASFPEVDTNSNLWPETLVALLVSADLESQIVNKNRSKLTTLVSRRNEIAHGQKNFIAEFKYYLTYEAAVYEVMYDLALQVEERLASTPYL